MSHILEVKNLSYNYDESSNFVRDALHNVSFTVDDGEIIGIVGHTGSGKSTLVQLIVGLLTPTDGSIYFKGKNIWENPKKIREIRKNIGLVFQYPEYQLFEETVYADIAFGPRNMGFVEDDIKPVILEICDTIGIPKRYLNCSPFDLSGGEKRRVAIAGIMAMRPKLLILDEPVAGLDPKGRNDIISMVKSYKEKYSATIMIISHNMEDMSQIADKLLVLNNGNLLKFDTVYNVFSDKELLLKSGLDKPVIAKIFDDLRSRGHAVPDDIFTLSAAVAYFKKRSEDLNNA